MPLEILRKAIEISREIGPDYAIVFLHQNGVELSDALVALSSLTTVQQIVTADPQ